MTTLPAYLRDRIVDLAKVGLSSTGQAFVTNFLLAEMNGRGHGNRAVLLKRIRKASDVAKAAAMEVFDCFVNDRK